jgi:hypothetical protein
MFWSTIGVFASVPGPPEAVVTTDSPIPPVAYRGRAATKPATTRAAALRRMPPAPLGALPHDDASLYAIARIDERLPAARSTITGVHQARCSRAAVTIPLMPIRSTGSGSCGTSSCPSGAAA